MYRKAWQPIREPLARLVPAVLKLKLKVQWKHQKVRESGIGNMFQEHVNTVRVDSPKERSAGLPPASPQGWGFPSPLALTSQHCLS